MTFGANMATLADIEDTGHLMHYHLFTDNEAQQFRMNLLQWYTNNRYPYPFEIRDGANRKQQYQYECIFNEILQA